MNNKVLIYGIGVVACFVLVWQCYAQPSENYPSLIDPIILDAEQVLKDLLNDKAMIRDLQEKITLMEADTHSSASVIQSQKNLIETYKARVETLQARYERLLALAKRLRHEADTAKTIAVIAVPTAIVAIVVAIVEAIVISKK